MPTCLIFDEMPVIRKIAERIMTSDGYETEVFESAEAVRDRLRAGALPDIVILSATGGNLDLIEVSRDIRRRDGGERTVILISLVERNVVAMMRIRRAGATGVLTKPFDAKSFRETLDFCIKGRAAAA